MIDLTHQQKVIESFERLVTTPRSLKTEIKVIQAEDQRIQPRNPIKLKGLEVQARKKKQSRSPAPPAASAVSHHEHHIHKMIVSNPFLLHTPELYAGGLYLDSVLNKHRLPCGLIPDFTYITVQDRVIKITLVEIEQSVKRVFHQPNQFDLRSTFRSEAVAAIDQVRSWQAKMENDDMRRSLLHNLSPLFNNYPVGIFKPNGGVSSLAQIELGYVLIVGSETINTPFQQQMVDDLYLNENILFMTYPMLVEHLRQNTSAKNMLKLGPHEVILETLAAPEKLLSKGPDFGIPRYQDNDPFGIEFAGLGESLKSSSRRDCAVHPHSIKEIFYRAKGQCEHAGCQVRIIQNDMVFGGLCPIYSGIGDDSDWETDSDTNFVGLFCHEHIRTFNKGTHYILGQGHPMNAAMRERRAYRQSHDSDALTYSNNWLNSGPTWLMKVLEIDTHAEPGLAEDIRRWSMAVVSLPNACQYQLHQIITAYYYDHRTQLRFNADLVQYLSVAGVISVCKVEGKLLVTPTIYTQEFIDRIEFVFKERTPSAIKALCMASARELEEQTKPPRIRPLKRR